MLKPDRLEKERPLPAPAPSGAVLTNRTLSLALLFIVMAVFLAYLDTLWFGFVHDDVFQIEQNTWLRSWRYLPRYFTANVWAFERSAFPGTFYRPLFLLWFRLQYLLFGLNPWGWHLSTILCHIAVTLLVFVTAMELLKDRATALFAALIFGLHPTHVDAVAWISGVNEPLFAVFLLASFLCYLKQRTNGPHTRAYWAASLALYALACLSKETAVILPVIIFACEMLWSNRKASAGWRNRARVARRATVTIAPYLALLALYMVARFWALGGFQNPVEEHSLLSIVLTWPSVLWFYIRHLVWPAHLIPFYSKDYYPRPDIPHVLLPALLVLAVGAGLWFWGKRSAQAALAIIWLVVPILPALDLRAFIQGHLVHDRYLYLPSFGFAMLVALAVRGLAQRGSRIVRPLAFQLGLAGVLALTMGVEIVQASACYSDQDTYSAFVEKTETSRSQSKENLARRLWQDGKTEESIKLNLEIWQSHPNDWEVNYNLGCAYYTIHQYPEAERYLSRAVQIDASRADAFYYLGLTRLQQGDSKAAASYVERAISIRPDAYHYHLTLGIIFQLQGNLPKALAEFQQELERDPDDVAAREQAEKMKAEIAARRLSGP